MRFTTAFTATCLALLLSACAGTPEGESVAAAESSGGNGAVAAAEPAPGSPDEIVCERVEVVGSHFKRKVCMTRAQRDKQRTDTQNAMRTASGSGPSTSN